MEPDLRNRISRKFTGLKMDRDYLVLYPECRRVPAEVARPKARILYDRPGSH